MKQNTFIVSLCDTRWSKSTNRTNKRMAAILFLPLPLTEMPNQVAFNYSHVMLVIINAPIPFCHSNNNTASHSDFLSISFIDTTRHDASGSVQYACVFGVWHQIPTPHSIVRKQIHRISSIFTVMPWRWYSHEIKHALTPNYEAKIWFTQIKSQFDFANWLCHLTHNDEWLWSAATIDGDWTPFMSSNFACLTFTDEILNTFFSKMYKDFWNFQSLENSFDIVQMWKSAISERFAFKLLEFLYDKSEMQLEQQILL